MTLDSIRDHCAEIFQAQSKILIFRPPRKIAENFDTPFFNLYDSRPQYSPPLPKSFNVKVPNLTASIFQDTVLFAMFYNWPKDDKQIQAADELRKRGWEFFEEEN